MSPPTLLSMEEAIRESMTVRTWAELPTAEEVSALLAQGKDVLFSEQALREARAISATFNPEPGRTRVGGTALTIDDPQADCLENALSFRRDADGTRVVGVHAVDVPAVVPVGSALDFSARRREATRFERQHGIFLPMFPRSLGNEVLSIEPGVERRVKTVELRFGADGSCLGVEIKRQVLVSAGRLNAELPAAEALAAGATPAELAEAVRELRAIASGLEGGSGSRLGELVNTFTREANRAVAEALAEAGLEASYRNQPDPNTRTRVESNPTGHPIVGGAPYVNWTAPLRRYADVDTQRAMDRLIDGTRPEGRRAELDSRMRRLLHARLNEPVPDTRLDFAEQLGWAVRP